MQIHQQYTSPHLCTKLTLSEQKIVRESSKWEILQKTIFPSSEIDLIISYSKYSFIIFRHIPMISPLGLRILIILLATFKLCERIENKVPVFHSTLSTFWSCNLKIWFKFLWSHWVNLFPIYRYAWLRMKEYLQFQLCLIIFQIKSFNFIETIIPSWANKKSIWVHPVQKETP